MRLKFFLSGVLAIVFEIFIFVLIFFALLPKTQKQYTFQEKTALEFIQIEEILKKEQPKTTQDKKNLPSIEKQEKQEKQPKQKDKQEQASPVPSPKVGSDIKKLFEKIDSSNPPVREERVEDERPKFSANTIKKKDYSFGQDNDQIREQTSKIQDALDSLWQNELEVSSSPPQDMADGEYDEWFAKVKEILYAKWTNSFYDNVSISVSIVIETDGSFRYRIIRYSKNSSYNAYMEELLKNLQAEKFPPYPKGRITLEVTFKTKEHDNE